MATNDFTVDNKRGRIPLRKEGYSWCRRSEWIYKGWICGVDDWIMMDYVEGLVINDDQGQGGWSGIDFLQTPQ